MSSQSASEFRARLGVEPLEDRLAPATFTVTNTNDAGPDSFRDAITRANANPGTDTIAFAIGNGFRQINILSALPAITDRVVIDGRTQGVFTGVPLIAVNGFGAGAGVNGIVIEAGGSGSVVRGLVINQFNNDAIRIRANDCHVVGNYIGVLFTGTEELSNGGNGVHILATATGNVVGGISPAARNVISGNDANGVLISGAARGNVVLGNYIGTDASGGGFVGNGVANTPSVVDGAGIRIAGNASGNVIGGTAAGARNLISANTEFGVNIDGASGNVVIGNFIGTNATGTAELGNFEDGVQITNGATGNVIGGATAAARNVISGNGQNGVVISGADTRGNYVRGNRIGASAANGVELGNGASGVRITDGASGNFLGGTVAGAGNIVTYNTDTGVRIDSGTSNALLYNRIFDNGGLGIDLEHDSVTADDTGDFDSGANGLLNFPELSFARLTEPGLRIRGSINTMQNKALRIEFYASSSANPSGYGEGQKFLGFITLQMGSAETLNFTALFAGGGVQVGQVITATATDELGNTSEFSKAQIVI